MNPKLAKECVCGSLGTHEQMKLFPLMRDCKPSACYRHACFIAAFYQGLGLSTKLRS